MLEIKKSKKNKAVEETKEDSVRHADAKTELDLVTTYIEQHEESSPAGVIHKKIVLSGITPISSQTRRESRSPWYQSCPAYSKNKSRKFK